jgi:hypothetical protein
MKVNDILGRLPLFIEIVFSIIALATENYWLFVIVGIAAGYDGFVYFAKTSK